MTEGTETTTTPDAEATASATAATEIQENGKEEKKPIKQSVDIKDVGPCKKHIKVTVDRADIDKNFEEKYKDLMGESWVPGFRPGKAPKSIVVRKFKKDVHDKV